MRLAIALVAGLLLAQPEPAPESTPRPVMVNTGAPMRVPSPCTEEDIHALSLTCTAEHPCPVYLELSEFERLGQKIFLTGNLHTGTVTLASILLASEDDGKTWYEPYERIRSAGLDQIRFADFEVGWIAGYVVHALPRDPFLLITSDGGRTWRRRPLWSESRIGLIEHFYFEDRRNGWLWLDRFSEGEAGRYELYESKTGGESWMLRQITQQPPPKKGLRSPTPEWRLRADAATRSYRLERGGPQKWQVVASFLIHAGECREEEKPLAEPPEPPLPPMPEEPPAPKTPRKPPSLKPKPR